jgi:hypothetical protein
MQFNELFATKKEQQSVIGQVECTEESVCDMIIGILSSVGMHNPKVYVGSSSKAIVITKKGNKYTLTLSMYTPPVVVSWEAPVSYNQLKSRIETAISKSQKIAAINVITLADSSKFFQFSIA